jgi:quercetin dioxygenase-like cupin family protein
MTLTQTRPGDVIDVRPLGTRLAQSKTRTLVRTENVEIVRILMRAGREIPEHEAPGEIIVQCLEGKFVVGALGKTIRLSPGELTWLSPEEPHTVGCLEDGSFLLTILLNRS